MLEKSDDFSLSFTIPIIKMIGFWIAPNRRLQILTNCNLIFSCTQVSFLFYGTMYDIFYHCPDFNYLIYLLCNLVTVGLCLFKTVIMLTYKRKFFSLVLYLQRNFLKSKYDAYEWSLMVTCKHTCTFFICTFTILTYATTSSYVISPLIENIGKNESDRKLVINTWIETLTYSPYYEIMYIVEVLCIMKCGFLHYIYDNFLCILNLHVANQFRILHHRLENMKSPYDEGLVQEAMTTEDMRKNESRIGAEYYATFKKYIRQHQILIAYCENLEEVYNIYALGQILVFSMILCLDAYQLVVAEAPLTRKFIFLFHLLGSMAQLVMFTYSCDGIIQESLNMATAAYASPYTNLPMNVFGKMIRTDLIIVIMRSGVPCYITACKFFPVSLETYTAVVSTGVSYFTLLRQAGETSP